ncbi:DNA polymerase iota isoform X1 [Rhagoletis pomonella]|uniref:DNA polymerase iota isoform X1 n=2 Tax=Rhagoletis pomonella TaxID=28610 RepID=UPI0017856A90|nr:DNA polymerase iota isoform X1 [Rhagoletis pomonella]
MPCSRLVTAQSLGNPNFQAISSHLKTSTNKMDFSNALCRNEPHQRTIIHLDMDCFYAQVEEIRDPTLRTRPLGIQQKSCLVTCNYVAREFGIKKLMSIEEAQRLCPTLILVNGEDLTPYRQMSQRIFDALLAFTPLVEKLGFDENYLDVSAQVRGRIEKNLYQHMDGSIASPTAFPKVEGQVYPENGDFMSSCACGCAQRLAVGSQIAKEIRMNLHDQLNITCCAGISYNKLLAKLVGSQHKPNQQTVLCSNYAEQFMRDLNGLHRVTGIGQKTESLLLESGIANITELQNCSMDSLRKKCGFETASKLKDLAFGRDMSSVRPSGKPKTIGLEDSCRPISVRTEVEERFRLLLMRLVEQVADDGRIPVAIKIILRKFDRQKKTSHRETKQVNILPSLFKSLPYTESGGPKVILADGSQEKLLKIILRLFERVVDLTKPFNITLIGLAFSKFQQRKLGSSSIANFLIKKTDLEVQSITSLTNTDVTTSSESPTPSISSTNSDDAFRSSPTTFQSSDQFYRRRATAASPIPMLIDNGSESAATNSDFSDFSETEIEPSPKKSRIGRLLMAKRRCLGSSAVCSSNDAADVASPSKLRVCDLRLNSRDSEKDFVASPTSVSTSATTSSAASSTSPASMTSFTPLQRFCTIQPPSTLLMKINRGTVTNRPYVTQRQISSTPSSTTSSPLPSPMDETCSVASTLATVDIPAAKQVGDILLSADTQIDAFTGETTNSDVVSTTTSTTTITGNLSNIPCPAGVDTAVFNELPLDVQNELIESWRSSLAAAAVAVANGNIRPTSSEVSPGAASSTQTTTTVATRAGGASPNTNSTQKNTLYRYFLRNK